MCLVLRIREMYLMTKCVYCGEFEATVEIMNPNVDDKEPTWKVCNDCKDVIKEQQKLSFGFLVQSVGGDFGKKYGEKLIKEAQENLDEHAERTGIPNISIRITKKLEGDKDE